MTGVAWSNKMKICFIGKYPPIQGGVSRENFWATYALAHEGFDIYVVSNAEEVEYQFRTFDTIWNENPIDMVNSTEKVHITKHFSSPSNQHSYIPWANPFVTKLASLATEVINTYNCDLIYSFYLEPYAMAAYLASQWTGVPYGIRHAGSDVGRLFLMADQQTAYAQVLRSADYILASNNTFRRFLHLGIDLDKLYPIGTYSLPTRYFCPDGPALNVNEFLNAVKCHFPSTYYQGVFNHFADKPFDPSLPTIGIYGKTGVAKGGFDLLSALGRLKAEGLQFNFLALTQGHTHTVVKFAEQIKEQALESVTWLLPFIPHWYVPRFIKSCTAVCFLERNFPVKIHHPIIAREVFACGTCLILSHEIAAKQIYADKLCDGENVLVVDPLNTDQLTDALRRVIKNPALANDIGMNGYRDMSAQHENFDAYARQLASKFKTIKQDVSLRRNLMSIAEMQSCLARLYVDDAFRKLFYLDPEENLGEYILDEQEKSAIKSVDRKMLEMFALTLKNKRKKKFQAHYPLLFKALEQKTMHHYYIRYYNLYPAKPYENMYQEIANFGRFMEQSLATDENVPSYLGEVARYELNYYTARFKPSSVDTFQHINYSEDQMQTSIQPDHRPFIREGVFFDTFKVDIIKVMSELRNDQTPDNIREGKYELIFQQIANALQPKIFGISPATRTLLSLCDGKLTTSELIEAMEHSLEAHNLEAQIMSMLDSLLTMKIIGVN
jgi:glycosyltransferase involved in cell wall biosynthesis